jgi:hypothetical protein
MGTIRGLVVMAGLAAGAHVAHADPANVHVAVSCAYYVATPDTGLQLRVDGAPQPGTVDYAVSSNVDSDGNLETSVTPSGASFSVAPGPHHLELATPDCTTDERDLTIGAATTISGRLAIANSSLRGTVGSPDGFGVVVGGFYSAEPASSGVTDYDATSWTASGFQPKGLWLGVTFERRYFASAFDWDFGGGSVSGTATSVDPETAGEASAYTQSSLYMRGAGRVGARLPLRDVALAAGSGIGAELAMTSAERFANPNGNDLATRDTYGGFFLPMWASVTYKPSCTVGFELLASYDVHPFTPSANGLSFGAGLTYQPSSSCSEPTGISVR